MTRLVILDGKQPTQEWPADTTKRVVIMMLGCTMPPAKTASISTDNDKKKLSQPQISLPVSLVSVGSDDVCETGAPYQVIKAFHDTRRVPTTRRFKDGANDESFVGSIQLEGVGALYNMISMLRAPSLPCSTRRDEEMAGLGQHLSRQNAISRMAEGGSEVGSSCF